MGYCDIGAVEAHNPSRRYGPQTTPNTDQVLVYITNRSAELDAMLLDLGISAPVPTSASVAYAWLGACCAYGAAADAEAAMFPASVERDETPHVAYLRKRWEAMTTALVSGGINLADAPRLPTTSSSRGPRGLGRDTTVCATPFFTRSQVNDGTET